MPFEMFCTSDTVVSSILHALSLTLLDSLRYFVPDRPCDSDLWMKYSLKGDGASMSTLLRNMRELNVVFLSLEKMSGDVFGFHTRTLLKKKKLNVLHGKLKID